MKTIRKPLTFAALFCALFASAARTSDAQRLPPRNYEDVGACPFECCTYREWSVVADTTIYKSRAKNAPAVFKVKKGERVTGLTGVVVTLEPGRAVVKKALTLGGTNNRPKVRLKPGDVLYLLHYEGEGFYKIWFRGKIYEDEIPYPPDLVSEAPGDPVHDSLRKLSEPRTVWWVKVRNKRGQVGWSKQDEHFDDMDACG